MQALNAAGAAKSQRLFVKGMIEHHKGALTMVQEEIDNGENPDAVELAQAIKDGQTAEITAMESLLARCEADRPPLVLLPSVRLPEPGARIGHGRL